MPQPWNQENMIVAFQQAIYDAKTDPALARNLCDPAAAKTTLAAHCDITIPDDQFILFVDKYPDLNCHVLALEPGNANYPNAKENPTGPRQVDLDVHLLAAYPPWGPHVQRLELESI